MKEAELFSGIRHGASRTVRLARRSPQVSAQRSVLGWGSRGSLGSPSPTSLHMIIPKLSPCSAGDFRPAKFSGPYSMSVAWDTCGPFSFRHLPVLASLLLTGLHSPASLHSHVSASLPSPSSFRLWFPGIGTCSTGLKCHPCADGPRLYPCSWSLL